MIENLNHLESSTLLPLGNPIKVDTPNNRARSIVIGIEKLVPKVGKIAAFVTSVFWPKDPSQVNIWDLIKDQVYEAIDTAILKQELSERKNELNALLMQLEQYSPDKGMEENSQILSIAISEAISLKSKLLGSKNKVHLIPLTSILSHIHLAILRERLTHGLDLYQPQKDKQKSSIIEWWEDLQRNYKGYKEHFISVEKEWSSWRSSTLSIENKDSRHGTVHDSFTKIDYIYKLESKPKEVDVESLCEATVSRIFNSSKAEVASYLALTFVLNRYLPDPDQFDINLSIEELGYLTKAENSPLCSVNNASEIIEGYDKLWIGVADRSTISPMQPIRDEAMYSILETDLELDEMIGVKLGYNNVPNARYIKAFQPLFKNHEEPVYAQLDFKDLNIHFQLPEKTEDMIEAPYICGLLFDSYGTFYNHCDILYWNGKQLLRTNLIDTVLEGANGIDFLLHAGPCYQIKAIIGKNSTQSINLPSFKVYLEFKEPW